MIGIRQSISSLPLACPLTGAVLFCALLWLARMFMTVCAGGVHVTGAARRERRIDEPDSKQLTWSAKKPAMMTVENRHRTQTK